MVEATQDLGPLQGDVSDIDMYALSNEDFLALGFSGADQWNSTSTTNAIADTGVSVTGNGQQSQWISPTMLDSSSTGTSGMTNTSLSTFTIAPPPPQALKDDKLMNKHQLSSLEHLETHLRAVDEWMHKNHHSETILHARINIRLKDVERRLADLDQHEAEQGGTRQDRDELRDVQKQLRQLSLRGQSGEQQLQKQDDQWQEMNRTVEEHQKHIQAMTSRLEDMTKQLHVQSDVLGRLEEQQLRLRQHIKGRSSSSSNSAAHGRSRERDVQARRRRELSRSQSAHPAEIL